jgi:WD40 repeat protein
MNGHILVIFCGVAILAGLLMPAAGAVEPLWTEAVTGSGELSCLVISADGSTIVAGGDKLIALSRDGRKLWTGWSGTRLAISRDGNYLVTSRDTTVRLISGTGTMLWDESLTVPVAELAMLPDASLIAAAGGTRVRIINTTGSGFRQNTSIAARHIRFFQKGDRLVITTKTGVQTSNLTLFSEWADTNVSQEFVEVAGDGSSFVTVTNNRVRLYARDGSQQWERALPGGNALAFAYSRDGSTIVVGRDDNTIEVLDGNGTHLWTEHAPYWVTSVAVSDDGTTIAAGSLDKTLLVYDRAGTELGSSTTKNPIKAGSVVVSGDGSVIAVVDSSTVYGFSRSQFTGPVTPPATPGAPLITTTTDTTTSVTPMHPAITTPPVRTTQASLSPALPFAVLAFLSLWRMKKT